LPPHAVKKKAERDVAGLQARIARAQKSIEASATELNKLNEQLTNLPADAPSSKLSALQKKIEKATRSKEDGEQQVSSLTQQISTIQGVAQQPGQNATQTKATLAETNKKLAALEQELKDVKSRMDLLSKKEEFDRLEDLKRGLSGQAGLAKYDDPKNPRTQGKDFAFKGQRNVQDPSVTQLLEQGYMNPDEDYKPGEKPNSDKHGFNESFFKTMAEFGFDLGGAWESPDAMHFELVQGLDLVVPAGGGAAPAAAAPAAQPAAK